MLKELLKPYIYMTKGVKNFSLYDMLKGKFYQFSMTGSVSELRKHLLEESLIFETEGIVPDKIIKINMHKWQTALLFRELQIRLNGRAEDNCWNREKTNSENHPPEMENETLMQLIADCQYIPIERIKIEAEREVYEKVRQIITAIKCATMVLNIQAGISPVHLKKYMEKCEKKGVELVLNEKKDPGKYKLQIFNFFYSKYFNPCLGHQVAIDSNGDIKPCLWHTDVIGHIGQDNLKDLVIAGKFDRYWELSRSKIEVCKDCEMRCICDDCRVFTLSKTRNLYAQSAHCSYDPYID